MSGTITGWVLSCDGEGTSGQGDKSVTASLCAGDGDGGGPIVGLDVVVRAERLKVFQTTLGTGTAAELRHCAAALGIPVRKGASRAKVEALLSEFCEAGLRAGGGDATGGSSGSP